MHHKNNNGSVILLSIVYAEWQKWATYISSHYAESHYVWCRSDECRGASTWDWLWVWAIEIRLESRCPQKCFLIWNYYVGCLWAPLLALTHSKETVFWSNLVFFTIKTRFWQYYS
jgi:hypothetical protein